MAASGKGEKGAADPTITLDNFIKVRRQETLRFIGLFLWFYFVFFLMKVTY